MPNINQENTPKPTEPDPQLIERRKMIPLLRKLGVKGSDLTLWVNEGIEPRAYLDYCMKQRADQETIGKQIETAKKEVDRQKIKERAGEMSAPLDFKKFKEWVLDQLSQFDENLDIIDIAVEHKAINTRIRAIRSQTFNRLNEIYKDKEFRDKFISIRRQIAEKVQAAIDSETLSPAAEVDLIETVFHARQVHLSKDLKSGLHYDPTAYKLIREAFTKKRWGVVGEMLRRDWGLGRLTFRVALKRIPGVFNFNKTSPNRAQEDAVAGRLALPLADFLSHYLAHIHLSGLSDRNEVIGALYNVGLRANSSLTSLRTMRSQGFDRQKMIDSLSKAVCGVQAEVNRWTPSHEAAPTLVEMLTENFRVPDGEPIIIPEEFIRFASKLLKCKIYRHEGEVHRPTESAFRLLSTELKIPFSKLLRNNF